MNALELYDALPSDDEDFIYDRQVPVEEGVTAHLRHTNDGPILRLIVPMDKAGSSKYRELAYDTITLLLSETTNNDACDVWVRERSAHLSHHDDLRYLNLPDDLSVVVIDAWIEDYLT